MYAEVKHKKCCWELPCQVLFDQIILTLQNAAEASPLTESLPWTSLSHATPLPLRPFGRHRGLCLIAEAPVVAYSPGSRMGEGGAVPTGLLPDGSVPVGELHVLQSHPVVPS